MIARLGLRWPGGELRRKEYHASFDIIIIINIIRINNNNRVCHFSVAGNLLEIYTQYVQSFGAIGVAGRCGGGCMLIIIIIIIIIIIHIILHSVARQILKHLHALSQASGSIGVAGRLRRKTTIVYRSC